MSACRWAGAPKPGLPTSGSPIKCKKLRCARSSGEGFSTLARFPLSVFPSSYPTQFIMKRLFLLLLLLAPLCTMARGASEKPNTVLIHPGEVIYARFEQKGKKLKLVSATKERDEQAQVVLTLSPAIKDTLLTLKVENKFAKYLHYKAEIRSLTLKKRMLVTVFPVVAGKLALEQLPPAIEELALHAFELEL